MSAALPLETIVTVEAPAREQPKINQKKSALSQQAPPSVFKFNSIRSWTEREAAVREMLEAHNEESIRTRGDKLIYREEQRIAKHLRELHASPVGETAKQTIIAFADKTQSVVPPPRIENALEARVFIFNRSSSEQRAQIACAEFDRVNAELEREHQERLIAASQPPESKAIFLDSYEERQIRFRQQTEASNRGYAAGLNGEDGAQWAIKQMQTANELLMQVNNSLNEQGVVLGNAAQQQLDATFVQWSRQQMTDSTRRQIEETARAYGESVKPQTELQAVLYLVERADDAERDHRSLTLAEDAVRRADAQQQQVARVRAEESKTVRNQELQCVEDAEDMFDQEMEQRGGMSMR